MMHKCSILWEMKEDAVDYSIITRVARNGSFYAKGEIHSRETPKRTENRKLGRKDREFFNTHMPSSIMWNVEVHHDWENGGICYLLSKEEHMHLHFMERAFPATKEKGVKRNDN